LFFCTLKINPLIKSIFLLLFIVFVLMPIDSLAQNSNVTIRNGPTSNGTWALASGTYTFTPNADNATVNFTDIQNYLNSSNVTILTARPAGTQAGHVFIDQAITENDASDYVGRTFRITAGGDINLNQAIDIRATALGYAGHLIAFTASAGNINILNTINTSSPSGNYGGMALSPAGSITMNATNITVSATLTAIGGNNTDPSNNGSRGGNGGAIFLNATAKLVVGAILSANGGNTSVSNSTVAASGGAISLTGTSGIRIGVNVSSLGGTHPNGGRVGIPGDITLSTNNTLVETGNEGQTAGIFSGRNLIKNGTGIFRIKGVNTYSGSTTVAAGTLQLGAAASIPDASDVTLSTGSTALDLNGFSETIASLAGSGKVTSTSSGNLTLTTGSGLAATFSGLIEDGAATLSLTKVGANTFTLTTPHTYSGLTTASAGILNIQHKDALGSATNGTLISGTATLQVQGGINVASEALTLNTSGIGLQNLSGTNSWGETITLSAASTLNASAGTLSLTKSNSINAIDKNLSLQGAGAINISGTITTGNGTITTSSGTFTLSGDNTYSGLTTVSSGVLNIRHNNALGTTAAGTSVTSGATLQLQDNITVGNEALTLNGAGLNSAGAVNNISGNNAWSGTITLASGSTIGTASGTLSLSNPNAIAAGTNALTLVGGSTGVLNLVGTHLSTGITTLSSGTLLLGAADRINSSTEIRFNGGTLNTAGFNETLGNLSLYAASNLELGSGDHTLIFGGTSILDYKILTIKGWKGTYADPGSSGTEGKLFIGNSQGVSRDKLDQIQFLNATGSTTHFARQLASGEIVPGNNLVTSATGHTNVRIINGPTSNGTWALASGTYTFTPNADNATVNFTDIQNYLNSSNVTILTARPAGTQAGHVFIDQAITENDASDYVGRTFRITAGGDINLNQAIDIRATALGYAGHLIAFTASAGNINILNTINTSSPSGNYGGMALSPAGSITMNATNITVSATLTAIGGNNTDPSNNGSRGGNGGAIFLNATAKLVVGAILSANGGNTSVSNSTVAASGGAISLTGTSGIRIGVNVSSLGGTHPNGGRVGIPGDITLSTNNTLVETGNEGQTAGIFSGRNLIKNGTGIFRIKGVNTYSGSTTVAAGTLQLGAAASIPDASDVTLSTGSTALDLNGFSETIASLAGSGKVTSTSSGNLTLTTGSGLAATFSGLIEDGAATLSLTKVGANTFTLTTPHTYSGLTTASAGILNIQHKDALGSATNGTLISGTATLQVQGGINVASEALTLNTSGIGLQNLSGTNSWGETITLSAASTLNASAGTLSLTKSNSINAIDKNLSLQGAGAINISGTITTGNGTITTSSGTFTLSGDNTYSGLTTVSSGVLNIRHNNALGTTAAGTSVTSGATLQLQDNITVGNEALTLNGAGLNSAGAVNNISGNNAWSGTITLASGSTIGTASGTLSLSNPNAIAAGTNALTLVGGSTGVLNLVGTHLSTGITTLSSGTLLLGAADRINSSTEIRFNGGTLNTAGFNETLGNLSLYAASNLELGSGDHTLIFGGTSILDYKILTIKGWKGTYADPGSSGTEGKLFIGNSQGVSRDKLDQIQFLNATGSTTHFARQLASGEIVPGNNLVTSATGHTNVRIINGPTSNGTWALASGTYTFTPNADNATVNFTDIQNYLNSSNVTILTARPAGTQAGHVFIDQAITENDASDYVGRTFRITAGGDINLNQAIDIRATALGYAGHLIAFTASAGNINILNTINTSSPSGNYGGMALSPAGSITMNATNITVSATLTAIGGNNTDPSNNGSRGGNGGAIFLNATAKLVVGAILSANGGNTSVSNSTVAASGGAISLTGTSGIRIGVNVSSLGGTHPNGGRVGIPGDITLSTNNTLVETGNEGQTAGIFSGRNLIKNGTGIFRIKGVNTYSGSTTVAAGTLQLGAAASIPDASVLQLNGGEFQTGGFTETTSNLEQLQDGVITLGSTVHTLIIPNFINVGLKRLTIKGWQGTFAAPGSTGTAGKWIVNTSLTASLLGTIRFYNETTGNYHAAIQLTANKEIVPGDVISTSAATKLIITTQPIGGVRELLLPTQPVIQIQDASSALTTSTANVTVAIKTGPVGGSLVGTTTVAALGGVARFTDLNITGVTGTYTLEFTSSGLTSATSTNVVIATSSNSKLASLGLSDGFIQPVFSPDYLNYNIFVGSGSTSINLTPTVSDAKSTVRVNSVVVVSGNASNAIALNSGNNAVTILQALLL
jgi:autotransporter-associated beta strand protein